MKGAPLSFDKIRDQGHRLKLETAELRNDLLAEGLIEPSRVFRTWNGTFTHESQSVTTAERAAIDAYLAKHEPRHFANADSGDDFHIFALLRSFGHKVHRACPEGWRAYRYSLDDKLISRADFIAFVDKLRASIGKPPIGVAA